MNCMLKDNEAGFIECEKYGIISQCVFLKNIGENFIVIREQFTNVKFYKPKGDWLKVDKKDCDFNIESLRTVYNDHLNAFSGKP